MTPPSWRSPLLAALVLLVTDVAVLGAMQMIMGPPFEDLRDFGIFLTVSSAVALAAGYIAPLLARGGAIRSVRGQLLLIPVIVVSLTVANLGFIGRLMFVSNHDLALLTLVLLYASVTAVVLGFILSNAFGLSIQSRHALARQQELEKARRDLIVAVSHDLRTPLASIRAMAESIDDGVVDDPAVVKRYLNSMGAEVRRLGSLIDDLFELSRIDAGTIDLHLEPSSLPDLISDTLESMGPLAKQRGISLEGAAAPGLPDLRLDAARIQRVLTNLVQNAIVHTPAGGDVTIQAQARDGAVEVQVRDTGEGVTAEDLPRIFEPFYRGDPSRTRKDGGSGLGLSIVKALVEAHGGTVSVVSDLGRGSIFTVRLPAIPSGGRTTQPRSAPAVRSS